MNRKLLQAAAIRWSQKAEAEWVMQSSWTSTDREKKTCTHVAAACFRTCRWPNERRMPVTQAGPAHVGLKATDEAAQSTPDSVIAEMPAPMTDFEAICKSNESNEREIELLNTML